MDYGYRVYTDEELLQLMKCKVQFRSFRGDWGPILSLVFSEDKSTAIYCQGTRGCTKIINPQQFLESYTVDGIKNPAGIRIDSNMIQNNIMKEYEKRLGEV